MTLAAIVSKLISFINLVIPVLTAFALVLFMYGVFSYVIARTQGNKESSFGPILWGIVAMFVLFSLWGIIKLVSGSLFSGV